jgi:putative hydrolase of the HAD superfamily
MKLKTCNMHLRNDMVKDAESIENIIFDFGGVICNIDFKLMERRFVELGFKVSDPAALPRSQQLVKSLECGAMGPAEFRKEVKKLFITEPSDQQLDEAWNALLLDIPESRIRCLENIRKRYRIFLLSNTNEIHYLHYVEKFRQQYGYPDFDHLFEKAWFSYRTGITKPDAAVFRHVLKEKELDPATTLFIDDSLQHIEGARKAGIHGFHLTGGIEIIDLFTIDN